MADSGRRLPDGGQAKEERMKINDMAREAHEIARNNGWHDPEGIATEESPRTWAAIMSGMLMGWAQGIESIRIGKGLDSIALNPKRAEVIEAGIGRELTPENPIWQTSTLALIATEVAEAMESVIQGDKANLAEELADVVIRVGDVCGAMCIDLEAAIKAKMERNKSRGYRHGGKAV